MADEQRKGWLSSNASTVITALVLFASLIGWGTKLEASVSDKAEQSKVRELEIRMDATEKLTTERQQHLKEKVDELSSDIKEMKALLIRNLEKERDNK